MSWPVIIAILVATALVSGVLLGGVVGPLLDLSGSTATLGVGLITGLVGAMLLARRRK